MKITTIETSGFASALTALRLPYSKDVRSNIVGATHSESEIGLWKTERIETDVNDIALLLNLEKRGDEHAKPVRGIVAYFDITAPIDFFGEEECYVIGRQRLFSESTMHTEGRGLSGHALREALDRISFGRETRRVDGFSYQTLHRIVKQRYNHRKYEWHVFIEHLKTLPMKELIFFDTDEEMKVHDKYMDDYNSGRI